VLHHNQDANLKDIAKHIPKISLLLTGTYGSIWDTEKCFSNRVVLNSELRRSDLSTHGMSEFRLVVGFIQVPFPYIGARRMQDILKITDSSEMNSWRLGNSYDRPIARRIAENAGSSEIPLWPVKEGFCGHLFYAINPVWQSTSRRIL
jgi:hypothetical protein